jgi:hypothetical protein
MLRRATTKQGLMLLALVLTGIVLVAGVGFQLYAVTTAGEEAVLRNDEAPLERLPQGR